MIQGHLEGEVEEEGPVGGVLLDDLGGPVGEQLGGVGVVTLEEHLGRDRS